MSALMPWRLKRLIYLARRIAGSMAHRGVRGTLQRIMQEIQPAPVLAPAWKLESLEQPFAPFALPVSTTPQVSIIIPVHGKLPYTLACLRSISHHPGEVPFEVIVVDDASPADDASTLRRIDGLQLLRNAGNLGFIDSCNAGAALARGSHLLFLNNDTQVTAGWLDRLFDCFVEDPACGIAGSRLVYPDGRLQEAGGIVFANADGWNYGRFDSPDDAQYLYRREVDYVSGAALMVESALFRQLNGFDRRYRPAYYEDTDLAFAVRTAGRRVIFQPESLVVHCEGITSGTDLQASTKQYQQVNRAKFAEKWAGVLAQQPAADAPITQAIHHRHPRHILIVDALTPDAARDSGSLRLLNLMRLLREMGWRISFMADNRTASADEIRMLGRLGVHTLCKPWSPSLARWLAREGGGLSAVMLCRHYVAAPNLQLVRRLAPHAKLVFDTVDLHFLREQRAATHTGNPALTRQASRSRKHELAVIARADITFVVSPVERELLAQEMPTATVELLSNVLEVPGRRAGFESRHGFVFIGGFGHPPNVDAVHWLVGEIFPRMRAQRPDLTLDLLGDIPESARAALLGPGIRIHGRVEQLDPWMDGCRVALAPLRYGAGVKGKINMPMSHGLPVVATTLAMEGMHLIDGDNVLLADTADTFATAALRLHDDPVLWEQLSMHGIENVRRYFSLDAARATLARVLPCT